MKTGIIGICVSNSIHRPNCMDYKLCWIRINYDILKLEWQTKVVLTTDALVGEQRHMLTFAMKCMRIPIIQEVKRGHVVSPKLLSDIGKSLSWNNKFILKEMTYELQRLERQMRKREKADKVIKRYSNMGKRGTRISR